MEKKGGDESSAVRRDVSSGVEDEKRYNDEDNRGPRLFL